jgi:hypothetical protein
LSCSAPVFEHDLAECRQTHAHEDGAWWGFLLVALTLGSLQIVFDRGQEDDWFASESITALTIAAAVSFVLLLWSGPPHPLRLLLWLLRPLP